MKMTTATRVWAKLIQWVGRWDRMFVILHTDQIARLLLDALLEHRFEDAAICVISLCGRGKVVPELLWRTGTEVLKSIPGNPLRVVQFYKYLFPICTPYQREMLLDLGFFLIHSNNDLTEAYELLKDKASSEPFSKDKLVHGYLGLFEYIFWKRKNMQLEDHSSLQGLLDSVEEGAGSMHNSMLLKELVFYSRKAMAYFHGLVDCDGIWDLFLTRHAELLVFHGQNEDAIKMLTRYRDKNPENPNTHRYLYHFLKGDIRPRPQLISVLEGLLHVDPTSELAEEYCKLLSGYEKEQTSIRKSLVTLFHKLDHFDSRKCLNTWSALSDNLDAAHQLFDQDTWSELVLKGLWEERTDWWPEYHFSKAELECTDFQSEWSLLFSKYRVARRFLEKDNYFVKRMRKLVKKQRKSLCMSSDSSVISSLSTSDRSRKRRHEDDEDR
ncbi:TATA box-binding protein-associated factor RNA polymerase I subunit A isoform X2 [Nematostella vectensis]|uniref:TATA box-binding protein-associated factor RNA polymerase I subunit A isoform X2 n=1 Tax=Nematostella vectensis TaxID=45351 RepID=UPI002076EE58|nr:TATA box-binding protein-associated factor RNA polymerase I subunit A isoform X2 [Nematostella vectensis]